jgi:hypothetical protein
MCSIIIIAFKDRDQHANFSGLSKSRISYQNEGSLVLDADALAGRAFGLLVLML